MLSQLYIKNIAVIHEATIDFTAGLNIFTGETGAGKTILIQAINAVLGERVSKDIIRTGETQAVVSAMFIDLPDTVRAQLEEAGYPPEDDGLLIYREISADGKTVCKINGRPATLSILKLATSMLIQIHGQHDNQQLLSPHKHLEFIDGYGMFEPMLTEYRAAWQAWVDTKEQLNSINTDEAEKARRMDLLQYQIDEIAAAELRVGEEDELRERRKLLQNAVNITQALGGGLALLDGDDDGGAGILSQTQTLMQCLETAARYMEDAKSVSDRASDCYYEIEAVRDDLRQLLDSFDCDPGELEGLEQRLDMIYRMKKKYGADEEEVLAFYDNACAELEQIETSDARAAALTEQLARTQKEAEKLAEQLSQARRKAADAFSVAVCGELKFLDMASAVLSVRMTQKPLSSDGIDEMELMLSTNVGEQQRPLAKVASGGELARIMLGIKNVMAGRGGVQTMIFDEVDTGVSGRAAQKIGQKLAQVAQKRQVLVVTHLAQVAAFAEQHLLIAKTARDSRTFTSITPLAHDERVRELARITAGTDISELALAHAREMIENASISMK